MDWNGKGVYTYDKNTKESRHFTHDPSDDYSLSDNAIYSICKDKEGGIWIGNYFCGIDYYPNQYATFEKYYPITGKKALAAKSYANSVRMKKVTYGLVRKMADLINSILRLNSSLHSI